MASGFRRSAPRSARSDSSDCGGTRSRSVAISPSVSKSVPGQHWPVRAVFHMISTVLDFLPDSVRFLEILGFAGRFAAGGHILYGFRYFGAPQRFRDGRIEERKAQVLLRILNEA